MKAVGQPIVLTLTRLPSEFDTRLGDFYSVAWMEDWYTFFFSLFHTLNNSPFGLVS